MLIGVISKKSDEEIVKEFFELFKTPWEFFQEERDYDIIITTEDYVPETGSGFIIVFGSDIKHFDKEQNLVMTPEKSGIVVESNKQVFPLYCETSFIEDNGKPLLKICETNKALCIEINKNNKRVLRVGYNIFDEVRFILTEGQPIEHASIPTIDIHIKLIRSWIVRAEIPFIEVLPTPAGYDFMVSITHDVDFVYIRKHLFDKTFFGFLYRGLFVSFINFLRGKTSYRKLFVNWGTIFTLPLVYLGLLKDFWLKFERYAEIEKGISSTYYIIPFKDKNGISPFGKEAFGRATKYDVKDILNEIKRLSNESEIGLHGIDAWHDSELASIERKRISQNTGQDVFGIRMHWLFYNKYTPVVLEKAGFKYDTTFGYNETVGYRGGTSQVFRPIGTRTILELPMHIQDTAMFYSGRLGLSDFEASNLVDEFIKNAKKFGGVITINWHHRSIAPERLWERFYREMIIKIDKNNVWFNSAFNITEWFRRRRSVTFEKVKLEKRLLHIQVSSQVNIGPDLVLRIHNPSIWNTGKNSSTDTTKSFTDIKFSANLNITFNLEEDNETK